MLVVMSPAPRPDTTVLAYVRATGPLNVSPRFLDDFAASIDRPLDEVQLFLQSLVEAGLVVREEASGDVDPLTSRRVETARITLAGERVLDSSC
jgi:DNA-binding IclR family transcriptional regulator